MKKESSTNSQKYSGIAEQVIKMLSESPEITKILLGITDGDKGKGNGISTINPTAQRLCNSRQKDYEKLVQNSNPEKFNESALEARDAQIKLLEQQLAHQEDWVDYWTNKYEKCLEELKKETTRWWRF